MEAIFLLRGASGPQLKRNPLGSIRSMPSNCLERRMCPSSTTAFALLASFLVPPLGAQERYVPNPDTPRLGKNTELMAVLISSSHCVGNSYPGFLASIDSMNRSLAARAKERGEWFVAIGVSNDWDPDSGMTYLKSLSAFNEFSVGNNWFNLGIAHYILADSLGRLSVPQVILVQRDITIEERAIRLGTERILARFVGPDKIVKWVNNGTPVP